MSDGDKLVQHLVNIRGVKRLLVHGTSLGGAVACHLSNNPNVEAIFADRTFSSLDSVVRDDFGQILRFAFNMFTFGRWKMKVAKKYLSSDKYKIISSDPQDTMIPELSSLKNGVARASLEKDIKTHTGLIKKQLNFYEICTIMNKKDTDTLFYILKEIFNLNLNKANEAYSKAKTKNNLKKKDDVETNASIELNFLEMEAERMNTNEDLFDMSGTNYSAHSDTYLDKTNGSVGFEKSKKYDIINHFVDTYKDIVKEEVKYYSKKLILKGDKNLEKSLFKYYIPEDSGMIESCLVKIKRSLCKLDSAGLTFHHIFQAKECNQMKMFKQFLINLEVWGSYQTLSFDHTGIFNIKSAKKASDYQISEVLESLQDAIKETKSANFPFLKLLIEKAGCVGYFLSNIQKHIISKTDEESANLLNRDDDINSESESLVNKGNTKATFEDDETASFLDITKNDDESIGHLVPLK